MVFYVEILECASKLFISGQYSSMKCASKKMSRNSARKEKKVTFDLKILSTSLHVPFNLWGRVLCHGWLLWLAVIIYMWVPSYCLKDVKQTKCCYAEKRWVALNAVLRPQKSWYFGWVSQRDWCIKSVSLQHTLTQNGRRMNLSLNWT